MSEVSNQRRGNLVDAMGPEVRVTSDTMAPDQWANNMIREVGKTLRPSDSYLGSAVIHYYTSGPLMVHQKDVSFIHQFVGSKAGDGLAEALNEQVAAFSLADLSLKMRQHYHPDFKHKTRNEKDLR